MSVPLDTDASAEAHSTTRRRLLRAAGGVVASGALLGTARSAAAQGALTPGIYTGTATTLVQYLNAAGQSLGIREYQNNVLVGIEPPKVGVQGLAEGNPFSLYVVPDPPTITGNEGVYEIHSALDYREEAGQDVLGIDVTGGGRRPVPSSAGGVHRTTGGGLLVEYWRLELPAAGSFQGILVDPHTAEALALNLINALSEIAPGITMVWPYPMAAGTVLAGQSDGRNLVVEILGNTVEGTRPFYSQVTATLVA
jgi:hypothetical protein